MTEKLRPSLYTQAPRYLLPRGGWVGTPTYELLAESEYVN